MKLLLAVICLLSCGTFTYCDNVTKAWYTLKLFESIVPAYKTAYEAMVDVVSDPFDQEISADNTTAVSDVASELVCAAEFVRVALSFAVNKTLTLREEIDRKLTDTIVSISVTENEISKKQRAVQRENSEVKGANTQLTVDEQDRKSKEENSAVAERDRAAVQNRVEEIRACLLNKQSEGSPKSASIFECIKPGEAKSVDTVQTEINTADENLRVANNRVDADLVQVSAVENSKNSSERQLNELRNDLAEFQSTLTTLRDIDNVTTIISEDFRMVQNHIQKFWTVTDSLSAALLNLFNYDLLVNPLNDVYEVLQRENVLKAGEFATINNVQFERATSAMNTIGTAFPQVTYSEFFQSQNCTKPE